MSTSVSSEICICFLIALGGGHTPDDAQLRDYSWQSVFWDPEWCWGSNLHQAWCKADALPVVFLGTFSPGPSLPFVAVHLKFLPV